MEKYKKIATVGDYGIYLRGKTVYAHPGSCLVRNPCCNMHIAIATLRDLELILAGKKKKIRGFKESHDVTYSDKSITVGCTTVSRRFIKSLIKKLS